LFNPKQANKVSDRERFVAKQKVMECSYEITKLKTTSRESPTKLDSDGLPVTDKELKVLRASEKEKLLLKDERPR